LDLKIGLEENRFGEANAVGLSTLTGTPRQETNFLNMTYPVNPLTSIDRTRLERLSPDRRVVVISVNPNAGSGERAAMAARIETELKARGYEVISHSNIDEIVHAVSRARADRRLRAVVAAGGDGTVSFLINRLPEDTPIAILPMGTENLLAKFLGYDGSVNTTADAIERGIVAWADVGKANGKRFTVMASCGFDADVVQRVHNGRAGHIRHWSYALPIIRAIRHYRYPELRITLNDQIETVVSRWAFVFNFPCYAMGLPICPDATGWDGELDLCTFRQGNLYNGLVYLAGIIFRRHRTFQDARFQEFTRLRIESDGEVPFQIDGDPGGNLPLEITVEPRSLPLLVPTSLPIPESAPVAYAHNAEAV
jgi:diacylglycerol kinase (ATP)